MKILPLILACAAVLWAFDYGDHVTVSHGGSDYERRIIGLPGQRILPSLDAVFSKQNASTWQAVFEVAYEDSVFFCSGDHPPASTRLDSAKFVPVAQVLFSMSLTGFKAAEALPDSIYWVVVRSGTDPPDSEKGLTWGKLHHNDLTADE